MDKSNFINNIKYNFEKSSDQIIRDYLTRINKKFDLNNDEHPWMRDDILNSDTYVCNIRGSKVKLNDVLFGESPVNLGQNIIVITGDKHIGKKTFANKLVEVCLNSVEEQSGNLKRKINKGTYRIPVIIDFEEIVYNESYDLSELIVQAIEIYFENKHTKSEINLLRDTVNKLLNNGRFLIYIINEEMTISLEEQINSIKFCKKEIQNIENCKKYNNIILFTISSEYDIKNTTLNNSYILTLGKLEEREVRNYLNTNISSLLPLIEESPSILEIMRYPEHLKMFEQLSNKNMLDDKAHSITNEYELYDFFLTQHISRQLQSNMKKENKNLQRVIAIKMFLQNYAWERLSDRANTKVPSRNFQFEDFKEIGLLNDSGDFCFSYLNYYLIAKHIMYNIKNGIEFKIPEKLLEAPMNISLVLASKMMDNEDCFERFWNMMDENPKSKVNLFVRVAKQSQFFAFVSQRLYKKIFDNLTRDFYDYTTIEALDNLENNSIEYLNSQYLRLEDYPTGDRNNIKKRYVYFLGISGNGIISEMIDELMEANTDLHLKYHIIRAMVESYDSHKKSMELINERLDEISEYCSKETDPVIKSDFSLLYQKARNDKWMAKESMDLVKGEVKETLSDNIYWKRAHAAGTIGRSKSFDAYEILIEQIKKELKIIYETKEEKRRNSIKVISYTVEAICELQDGNNEIKERSVADMLKTIDIKSLGDDDIEDAYSTIITGIEYIINPEPNKLPFNLGGRFRNNLIEHKKVLRIVLQNLVRNDELCDDVLTEASEKLKQLEEITGKDIKVECISDNFIKDKLKILHITDLHKIDDSTDNNLIVYNLENNIKDVDILLVTGDLRNFGGKYDDALIKLNSIVDSLKLLKSDVFIVPGNHDSCNYAGKDDDVSEIRKTIHDNIECYHKCIDNLHKSFDDYKKFLIEFYEGANIEQGGICNKLHPWKNCINILTMNTSLLCDKNSEQKKIVDIHELTHIEKNDEFPTICISHHDIEQIFEDHKNRIQSVFENLKVSAMLSGDIHRSGVKHIQMSNGTIPNYICGKLSADPSDKWSDCNVAIYEVDLKASTLTPKLYKWEHGKFSPDTTFMKKDDDNLDSEWEYNPIELK